MNNQTVEILLNFAILDNPRTPKSKKMQVNYSEIMGGDLSDSVRNLLDLGTQQRRLLVQALTYAGAMPNPQNLIGAVNAYIPALWKIQKSLEFSKDTKIKIMKPLEFEWNSVLCSSGREMKTQKQGVFVFELTFVLVVRALSHYNQARRAIERISVKQRESNLPVDPSDIVIKNCFKEAIKELRVGAGVLEFAANDVVAHWKRVPQDPLPETRPTVLRTMSQFFLAMAQRVFIANILLMKKYSLLPNLLLGLSDKYHVISSAFLAEKSANNLPTIHEMFIEESLFFVGFGKTLAYKYLSLNLETQLANDTLEDLSKIEEAVGCSIGYIKRGVQELKTSKVSKSINCSLMKKRFQQLYQQEVNELKTKVAKLEDENASIYYAAVNYDLCDLPTRSQYKFMMQLEKFVMPSVDALSFEQLKRAPPGVDQATFNEMTPEIQDEMIAAHKAAVVAQQEAERKAKKGGGMFGFNKRKKKEKTNAPPPKPAPTPEATPGATGPLVCPPGADPSVFAALPREMQLEIIAQNGGGAVAPAANSRNQPAGGSSQNKNNNLALW